LSRKHVPADSSRDEAGAMASGYPAGMDMTSPMSRYQLAETGSLLADPARAAILLALIDGSARPATELALGAGVAPATASVHLRKLVEGGLLALQVQGRHRYYRLAGEHVAQLIETFALSGVPRTAKPLRSGRVDPRLRRARTCYRHLAGRCGVALFERLRDGGGLVLGSDAIHLAPRGQDLLRHAGLLSGADDLAHLDGRTCLDWTERRFHLAGPLGVELTRRLFERGWMRPRRDSRALDLGAGGAAGLRALGIGWDAAP
jgi:DNA-binding transcriptional ArsR family regulator